MLWISILLQFQMQHNYHRHLQEVDYLYFPTQKGNQFLSTTTHNHFKNTTY